VIVIGRLELSEDNPPTIIVDQVQSIDAKERGNEFLVLRAPQHDDFSTLCDSILTLLNANPGDCEVAIEALIEEGTVVRVKSNNTLRVRRSGALERALKELGCGVSIETTAPQARV
jgi:predicted nucleic acid-binding protein